MTNQERDSLIREKLNEGLSLSDVQKLLASEYGMKMTYFELRMIVSTLDIDWSNQEKKHTPTIAPTAAQESPKQAPLKQEPPKDVADSASPLDDEDDEDDDGTDDMTDEAGEEGGTQVTMDDVPLPGAVMSGHVKFASGASGKWVFNRMGQLGLAELDEGSEKPSQEDLMLFQQELQAMMQAKRDALQMQAFDGRTKVEINPLVKPGCDLNGTVTFASGATGEWFIAGGQLDYELAEGSPEPTKDDISLFQIVLSKKLKEKGMA